MTRSSPLIVIIGAGAAGLMAAIFAAGDGRRVLVVERTRDGGRKILISGGGRCNVLPSVLAPERFVTDSSPNTMRNLLRSWPLAEQRAFFETTLGLPLALEEETGKLFPVANQARAVRDALVARRAHGVGVETSRLQHRRRRHPQSRAAASLADGTRQRAAATTAARWVIRLERDAPIDADAVVLATGGLSVPTTGSDGTGLDIARRLGHTIHETYPALTPLVADPPVHDALAGVSLSVRLRAPVHARTAAAADAGNGRRLPVHASRLQRARRARHLARRGARAARRSAHGSTRVRAVDVTLRRDVARAAEAGGRQAGRGALVRTRVRQHLPDRLADWLMRDAGVTPDQPVATLTRDVRRRLVERLTRYALPWTSDEGYRKAEVTGGGVALDEVRPKTCESRRHPGLFLCGEMLDAFGPIGGHNFAWAWATGRLAGRGAAVLASVATPTDVDCGYNGRSGRISTKERFHHGLDGLPQAAADRHHRMDR